MTPRNLLQILLTLIFGQKPFELSDQKLSGDGPQNKKPSEHIWQS